ncbi:MAG: winged helix-turn-helix domain-containing protein [Spirosomataceae bacterium]
MKRNVFSGGLFIIALLVFSVGFLQPSNDLTNQRMALAMREIGHQLLLHAGDSTSRVLPIKQLNERTYQIEFQRKFSFVPDTLVKLTQQRLVQRKLPSAYLVHVFDCSKGQEVYAFERTNLPNEMISCLGRTLPTDCYKIQITFAEPQPYPEAAIPYRTIGVVLLFSALLGFVGGRYLPVKKHTQTPAVVPADEPDIKIGRYGFYPTKRILWCDNETTELSDKETKLLTIFALAQNKVIERERLLKEVWEDEGVYVGGRTLDVFVSKLRKKLQKDNTIRLTNSHGKGYKLETNVFG